MSCIVYQTDKKNGIKYAYESFSYWDKEKKQPRAKRTLIGKRDSNTGEIIPTDGRGRKHKEDPEAANSRKQGNQDRYLSK